MYTGSVYIFLFLCVRLTLPSQVGCDAKRGFSQRGHTANMYITPSVAVLYAFYLCMKQVFKYELWLCDLTFSCNRKGRNKNFIY